MATGGGVECSVAAGAAIGLSGVLLGSIFAKNDKFNDQPEARRTPKTTLWGLKGWCKGDPKRPKSNKNTKKSQKEQLRKTSPRFHIDKITAPLLIVHGRKDYNVRIEQAETLMDALDEKDIPYEVMIKKEEGHNSELRCNEYISHVTCSKGVGR